MENTFTSIPEITSALFKYKWLKFVPLFAYKNKVNPKIAIVRVSNIWASCGKVVPDLLRTFCENQFKLCDWTNLLSKFCIRSYGLALFATSPGLVRQALGSQSIHTIVIKVNLLLPVDVERQSRRHNSANAFHLRPERHPGPALDDDRAALQMFVAVQAIASIADRRTQRYVGLP